MGNSVATNWNCMTYISNTTNTTNTSGPSGSTTLGINLNPTGASIANMIGAFGTNSTGISPGILPARVATVDDVDKIIKRLEGIEKVLYIPIRDTVMEEKYANLKRLYEEYTEELEALKTWEILQESA